MLSVLNTVEPKKRIKTRVSIGPAFLWWCKVKNQKEMKSRHFSAVQVSECSVLSNVTS